MLVTISGAENTSVNKADKNSYPYRARNLECKIHKAIVSTGPITVPASQQISNKYRFQKWIKMDLFIFSQSLYSTSHLKYLYLATKTDQILALHCKKVYFCFISPSDFL